MAEAQRGQDELGGHVDTTPNARDLPATRAGHSGEPAQRPGPGSNEPEGRDVPPAEPMTEGKRSPRDPWMGGG